MNNFHPTRHSMQRRMVNHNYALPGFYHITVHVAEGMGQPLGQIEGSMQQPDGSPDAPHVTLTPVGNMVREELLTSISKHYPMITIDTFVIMPEHLHILLQVKAPIVNSLGHSAHLGQVIAGFKKGCNRRYWAMTGQDATAGAAQAAYSAGKPLNTVPSSNRVPSGFPAGGATGSYKVPSWGTTGRTPLFAYGYCDVMPIDADQLATQRAYIKANPRSRMLRSSQRDMLAACRKGYTTALTPSALRGFLQRECQQKHATPDALSAIECRLLLANGKIALDTYGNRQLLDSRLLPVVCHRKDKALFEQQRKRCLEEAARGTILVSPRIAAGEQEIMNEAVNHGYPTIIISDNGFPERYHPSAVHLEQCAADQLILVTPWQYQYRGKNEQVTVPFCKAMNCVAQALCHQKDDWWKNNE